MATLRLSKPRVRNALCAAMARELLDALEAFAGDDEVRAVVLTGEGPAFCSGSDVTAPPPVPCATAAERGEVLLEQCFNPLVRTIADYPKPVVVALNGPAVGGGVGLALSADVVLASTSSELRLTFGPMLGLVPDLGCTWWLPQLAGRARALGAMVTGESIPARRAQEWGLVWDVVPDADLEAAAMALAMRLAHAPGNALVATRRLVDRALGAGLARQLELEREVQVGLMDGAEFAEGLQAFRERREPRFA